MRALVRPDAWRALRRFTPARIALGRAGTSLPTSALLELGVAQAQARDAVHEPAHEGELREQLLAQDFEVVAVHSAAADRQQYLLRPDLGRRLDAPSRERLQELAAPERPDVVFVLADGLSELARARHGLPLLLLLRAQLHQLRVGPIVLAQMARVALGDEIGEVLRARQLAILIGERPGLSAPDSLGIYFTHAPAVGRTDAERNCISNVRPEGLDYGTAAQRLLQLMDGARRLGRSGIALSQERGGHSDAVGAAATMSPARHTPR
ncbi:MAG TPA: ethanolamine ammonia-lyase subunit EutC [Burkholderiaceae bacterium]|nr:ethanolamine ammonia-lyase subunit EutC [Burkholderiaceae bacterium]